MPTFEDLGSDKRQWLTALGTPFYPDYLDEAKVVHEPTIKKFIELVDSATSSIDLFNTIQKETGKQHTQLLRVFKKYVLPGISVEATKVKKNAAEILKHHSHEFRDIESIRNLIKNRPTDDEALVAVLQEYSTRGSKGYTLTEAFFEWFENKYDGIYTISGPKRAGTDIQLRSLLKGFTDEAPTDFVIRDATNTIIAAGYARYDSDRGGAQEDDRTGGNSDKITKISEYNNRTGSKIKIIFLNDGPGLALGSMWRDYAVLDAKPGVLVCTLKMLEDRLTQEWLENDADFVR
ncbi:hypothetical protein V3W47_11770 [Deinococcus sp. YIM 134068]|uniref:hypothetical protein n=1 Tax=Deinococcus lichenicola TaxID=3118910 RepID=UPI002F947454